MTDFEDDFNFHLKRIGMELEDEEKLFETVNKYCLDKQKVKDALDKANNGYNQQLIYNLKKELGLE